MSWDEAFRLARLLARDPSSQLCAAMNGWASPWPAEAFVLADLYDLAAARWTKNKAEPHKRPSDQRQRPRPMPQSVVLAALAARGHGR